MLLVDLIKCYGEIVVCVYQVCDEVIDMLVGIVVGMGELVGFCFCGSLYFVSKCCYVVVFKCEYQVCQCYGLLVEQLDVVGVCECFGIDVLLVLWMLYVVWFDFYCFVCVMFG